jgi:hypothetical protein
VDESDVIDDHDGNNNNNNDQQSDQSAFLTLPAPKHAMQDGESVEVSSSSSSTSLK